MKLKTVIYNFLRPLCLFIIVITFSQNVFAQTTVSGVVSDVSGTLIGVTVVVENTLIGTVTDIDGKYTLNVPSENSVLQFSYIGYNTVKEEVGNRTKIDVQLTVAAQSLDEVVVIGYGTTTVKDLTSSVASAKTEDIEKGANASVDNMLQGRIAGLNMTLNSAQPGAGLDINIRGAISPNGNNNPLYVIDGVPITTNSSNVADISGGQVINMGYNIDQSPLNTINPADIVSIDVLKDASAAAIYGSASANGVIIITTKRGTQGKPTISYDGSYTLQVQKPYAHDLLNAQGYMQQRNMWEREYAAYNKNTYPYGQSDYNNDGVVNIQDYNDLVSTIPDYFTSAEMAAIGNGFDWLDYIVDEAYVTEHNLSIRGGTEQTKYFISYNYYINDGLLKKSDLERNTLRFNFDQSLFSWLKAGLNVNYSHITSDYQGTGYGNVGQGHYNLLECAYRMVPTVGATIDPTTGAYSRGYDEKMASPQGYMEMTDVGKNIRLFINPTLESTITKDLTFKLVGGFDSQNGRRNNYIPSTSGMYLAENGLGYVGTREVTNKSLEGYFNYSKVFGEDHRVSGVLGFGGYKTEAYAIVTQATGFFTDAFGTDNMALGSNIDQRYISTSRSEITKLSQFARINYSFKEKYTVAFTGRNDGSSVFAKNKKWGFFPSVSAAWRIGDEEFMSNTDNWLSNLKFRAGYGASGNEPRNANSLSTYATGPAIITGAGSNYMSGVILSTLGNDDLSWETNETINLGLEFGLFDQKISGSAEYFIRTAKDLLDYKTLPSNNPVTSVIANVGSTQAKGFEFILSSININNKNFQWVTDFNISQTIYRWKERNPQLVLDAWVPEDAEMSAVYGWETDGIFHNYDEINAYVNANGELYQPEAVPGNIKYIDHNGDGVLDDLDNHFLGRTIPSVRFGLNNSLSYKRFTASFYFYGAMGNILRMGDTGNTLISDAALRNTYETIVNYWSMENQDGKWPGIGTDATSNNNRSGGTSDFWYKSGAYAKLKNVTLTYSVSKNFASKLGMGSLDVSVDMQNLATITDYFGFDPELGVQFPYPQAYSFTFGLKASF